MDNGLDIKSLLQIIKFRFMTIVLTTILFACLTTIATIFFLKTTYEATEYMIVGKEEKESKFSETQEFNRLLASSVDLIKSPIILNALIAELNLQDESLKTLEEKISVQNSKDSQIIHIIVQGTNREQTREMAHALGKISTKKLNQLLRVKEIKVLSTSSSDVPVKQVGGFLLNISIGTVMGLLAGIGVAMFKDHLDETIRDVSQIEEHLGLPALGQINTQKHGSKLNFDRNDAIRDPNQLRGDKSVQSSSINKTSTSDFQV
ncbi:hypothetical protein KUV80_11195 [Fictibacillus nanhaiensis]|uniref:YveK family protein n=1 Tax=Fictibacillus nanhaiensis TaxID=742169 RepID=UPI001C989438|nr:Wzz/FepE/Etk N-terminal domain-containing protein [Fictibacillus nanhaiensis]MBY6037225.1 hypothetical protein [Fictibacillus nanhaiensis]